MLTTISYASMCHYFRVAALKGNHEIADLLLNSKGTECDVNFIDKETGKCIKSNLKYCICLKMFCILDMFIAT